MDSSVKRWWWVVVCLVIAASGWSRELVAAVAPGKAGAAEAEKKYVVVSVKLTSGPSGIEEELNKHAAEGWRYAGGLPMLGDKYAVIFER